MDIDPEKTSPQMKVMTSISMNQSVSRTKKSKITELHKALDDAKPDKMIIVKVQIQPGSSNSAGTPIMIYPEKKKFQVMAEPCNVVSGERGYRLLHDTVKKRGFDAGLGCGGCKIYLDAYVSSSGLLRVMLNNVRPMQKW